MPAVQKRNSEMVDLLSADFYRKQDQALSALTVPSLAYSMGAKMVWRPQSFAYITAYTSDPTHHFDAITGSSLTDSEGVSRYRTLNGSTYFGINASYAGDFTSPGSSWTWVAWLRPTITGSAQIMAFLSMWGYSPNFQWRLLMQGTDTLAPRLQLSTTGTTITHTTSDLTGGAYNVGNVWAMFAWRWQIASAPDNLMSVWLNARELEVVSGPTSALNSGGPLELGRDANTTYPFTGDMGHFAVWQRYLADDELLAYYYATRGIHQATYVGDTYDLQA